MTRETCTSLDHCYPQNAPGRKTAPGTPCFCGRRAWSATGKPNRRAPRRLKVGDVVTVLGSTDGPRTIEKREREDGVDLYILDAPVAGRKYYERAELMEAR
jgi:hypothetical protein